MIRVGRQWSKLLHLVLVVTILLCVTIIDFSFCAHMIFSSIHSKSSSYCLIMPNFAWSNTLQEGVSSKWSITIDDFEKYQSGSFPGGWQPWRGNKDSARNVYTIQKEQENKYLRANDDGSSIIIRKRLGNWDANQYPILSWRWRARVLPENGNESIGPKNDSSVAVYVVLDQNFIGIPKTLKYVWSTTLPVGTYHRREGMGRPHVIVLQSGKEKLGEWVNESVDVYADYVRIFGKPPPRKAVGIGVLTDGNATGTESQGDYDSFVIQRRFSDP